VRQGRLAVTRRGREGLVDEAELVRFANAAGLRVARDPVLRLAATMDAQQAVMAALVERVAALERQQVAFIECDAQMLAALRAQPQLGERLVALEQQVTLLAWQVARQVALGQPGRAVLSVAQFADAHRLEVAQVEDGLHTANIPLSPVYGEGAAPVIARQGHVALAAALRARGIPYAECADCRDRDQERRQGRLIPV
jgi:hypothetical protein